MARPRKDGLSYFPHDTDASSDEKIESLRFLYGNDGYTFYFILLERIYRTNDAELNISAAETLQILGKKIGISPELFGKILETSFNIGCFDRAEFQARGVLTSEGIRRRAEIVLKKRNHEREKRGLVAGPEKPAEFLPSLSGGNSTETPERKEKERKGKERKGKDIHTQTSGSEVCPCPHKEIIDLYHSILPSLPKIASWGKVSSANLRARWNESKDRQSLGWWEAFFLQVKASDFLMGRTAGKSWSASLGWLVLPTNLEKVLNGNYSNKSNHGGNAMDWLKETCTNG